LNFDWKSTVLPPEKKFKSITKSQLRKFGIDKSTMAIVDTLDDLEKNPPGIVVAKAIKNLRFVQN